MNRRTTLLFSAAMIALAWLPASIATSAPTTVSFRVLTAGAPVANTEVTLYLSYGPEVGRTNAQGDVTLRVGAARYCWVEVNGQRLDRCFEIQAMPPTMDVALIGTRAWPTRRAPR